MSSALPLPPTDLSQPLCLGVILLTALPSDQWVPVLPVATLHALHQAGSWCLLLMCSLPLPTHPCGYAARWRQRHLQTTEQLAVLGVPGLAKCISWHLLPSGVISHARHGNPCEPEASTQFGCLWPCASPVSPSHLQIECRASHMRVGAIQGLVQAWRC